MSKMGYPTQSGFPIHQDCANFRNGICTLAGVAVDSNGLACPNFTPKNMTAKPHATRAYPEARQPYQPYPPQITQGHPPYIPPHPRQTGYGFPPMPYPPRYPYTPFPHPNPPQTGYSFTPPYAYPPRTGYGHPYVINPWCPPQAGYSYPRPEHAYDYTYPSPYAPQTRYGYRSHYSFGHSAPTPPRTRGGQIGGFGARGGGRGGGRGWGRRGRFAAGTGGSCVCPNCAYSTPHMIGTLCYQQVCPQCGSRMTNESTA